MDDESTWVGETPERRWRRADGTVARCRFSASGRCELAENALAALIHGNAPEGDPCADEGGTWHCYLDTK